MALSYKYRFSRSQKKINQSDFDRISKQMKHFALFYTTGFRY